MCGCNGTSSRDVEVGRVVDDSHRLIELWVERDLLDCQSATEVGRDGRPRPGI